MGIPNELCCKQTCICMHVNLSECKFEFAVTRFRLMNAHGNADVRTYLRTKALIILYMYNWSMYAILYQACLFDTYFYVVHLFIILLVYTHVQIFTSIHTSDFHTINVMNVKLYFSENHIAYIGTCCFCLGIYLLSYLLS